MNPRPRFAVPLLLAWAVAVGCEAPRGPVSVDSDDPDLKVQAIKRDAALRNPRDNPQLVRDLDDEDPAIRFYAVNALGQIAGNDFGYRFYDGAEARKPAVARWRAWLANPAAGDGGGSATGN